MKKIFIEYNPYKLETIFTVENSHLAENSKIGEAVRSGVRLQEWVEELPRLLLDEYNDNSFAVSFHGTLLDFEDLAEVFAQAREAGLLTYEIEHLPAKETADKEELIAQVFNEIQEGPVEDLRAGGIVHAFQQAKSKDFEVDVVATMSAGKSTLINAMLGTQLMPSKQEACTAIITRVKDTDQAGPWKAKVYDANGNLLETQMNLSVEIMRRLNDDPQVSKIEICGNIPFVSAEDSSLVLVDTPGPNNARDKSHGKIQRSFLSKASKTLVLYVMEGTFGSTDDNELLDKISQSMQVGGKQSKDRYIFVVNKMDNRKTEDGGTEEMLSRVRSYLKDHGIERPNLFPVAALPAMNIRLLESDMQLSEDKREELKEDAKIGKLNRTDALHLEKFATLPAGVRNALQVQLESAECAGDRNKQALYHTGIPSLEAAIRQYVQKYAKTAKIRNIADTVMKTLEDAKCEERLKEELTKNQQDSERIVAMLQEIQDKINAAKSGEQFKHRVALAAKKAETDAQETAEEIIDKYQRKLIEIINAVKGDTLTLDEAEVLEEKLGQQAKRLEPEFRQELEEMISTGIVQTWETLLCEYKEKLRELVSDLGGVADIQIEPLQLVGSSVEQLRLDPEEIERIVQEEEVEDGEEWVENTDKKWYKPWTWFQESGYFRTKYTTVQVISADVFRQAYLSRINEMLVESADEAKRYAKEQTLNILERFEDEFNRLDQVLNRKLEEYKRYATEKDKAEQRLAESRAKKKWLEMITDKVEAILEI